MIVSYFKQLLFGDISVLRDTLQGGETLLLITHSFQFYCFWHKCNEMIYIQFSRGGRGQYLLALILLNTLANDRKSSCLTVTRSSE